VCEREKKKEAMVKAMIKARCASAASAKFARIPTAATSSIKPFFVRSSTSRRVESWKSIFSKDSASNRSLGSYVCRRNMAACAAGVSETVTEVQRILGIDLRGKKAFVAGVADDKGFGWAISKALAQAGCEIILGTWVPALNIFQTSYNRGKFDESATLSDGSKMQFKHIYPMDAVFDTMADVPEDVRNNKRYKAADGDFSVEGVAKRVKEEVGNVDIIVHSLANGPEVQKPLLETSRNGYLAAVSASSYSFVSMVQHFGPIMNKGGAAISLTYLASEKVIPGYGGGMSSAKAALESDTQVLAYEAGRKYGIRVNTISAGALGSRAARAIGFIDDMINYSIANGPLQKELAADEVANVAAFLCSPLSSGVTGACVYVDNGVNIMGLAEDSKSLEREDDD
jgi:enoyl-[acyl-carrier protein] reductase I